LLVKVYAYDVVQSYRGEAGLTVGGVKHPPGGHRFNEFREGIKEDSVRLGIVTGFSPVISIIGTVLLLADAELLELINGRPRVSANSVYFAATS
jgi:hypothetical protein